MTGIVAAISAWGQAISQWLGLQSKRLDLNNAADIKASKERVNDSKEVDRVNAAIAKGDVNEIRNQIAE
jgi:hypothetical protein